MINQEEWERGCV